MRGKQHSRFVISLALTLGLAEVAVPSLVRAQARDADRHFAFHSNFWVNLHQFLYVAARARLGYDLQRPAIIPALGDTVGYGALAPALRRRWERALLYYQRTLARRDAVFDSGLVAINDRLAELPDDGSSGVSGIPDDVAAALTAAAPAYRALWWRAHDAANRRWLAAAQVLIRQRGDSMAALQARALHQGWPAQAIHVDVAGYATWAGAYTTNGPAHITIASRNPAVQGTEAFETLFHESMHTMDDSLLALLRSDAKEMKRRIPRDPTHPFIFFTAGELTRRLFPGHVPYAEASGLWKRVADMDAARVVLQRVWLPWLDGRATFERAVRDVVATWEAAPG